MKIVESLERAVQPSDVPALLELSNFKEMRFPKVAVEADQLDMFGF